MCMQRKRWKGWVLLLRYKTISMGVISKTSDQKSDLLDPLLSNISRLEDTTPPPRHGRPGRFERKRSKCKIFCNPDIHGLGWVGHRYRLRNAKLFTFLDVRSVADPPPLSTPRWFTHPSPYPWPDVFYGWPIKRRPGKGVHIMLLTDHHRWWGWWLYQGDRNVQTDRYDAGKSQSASGSQSWWRRSQLECQCLAWINLRENTVRLMIHSDNLSFTNLLTLFAYGQPLAASSSATSTCCR